jgi:citronellol/citronellal dehydrogenase
MSGATLRGRTLFITGASRGIGLAIAVRAARDGANIVLLAKTVEPNPKLPGTIHSAAAAVLAAGGEALAIPTDIRDTAAVEAAVRTATAHFGGIDILVNNASAISLTPTPATPMKRFDLMVGVNVRGTFACTQACLPQLMRSAQAGRNPHVLNLSPPLSLREHWFAPHVAYSMAKYGMSLVILGVAGEFRGRIGVNALWPRTAIDTAAMNEFAGHVPVGPLRSPRIMADAAYLLMTANAVRTTGNFFIDDELLAAHGITDLSVYNPAGVHDLDLMPDFFCPGLAELRGAADRHHFYPERSS